MPRRILLLGAYGQQNIGDEIMLSILVNYLKELYPNCRISCNSNNPVVTSATYDVNAFHTSVKKDFFKKVLILLRSDVYLYGGGSLLVELRMNQLGRRAPLYRGLILNLIGRLLGKRIIYVGVGAENVRPGWSRTLVRLVVGLSHRCYARDVESQRTLLLYGCSSRKVILGAEIAFVLDGLENKRPQELRPINSICVLPVYRIMHYEKYHEQYVNALRELSSVLRKQGRRVDFFAMQTDPSDKMGDSQIIAKINDTNDSNIGVRHGYLPPQEFIKYLHNYDLVLSSRYHGLVCMLITGRPAISLTEFEKSRSILKTMKLDALSFRSQDVSVESLLQAVNNIEKNYTRTIETIKEQRLALHQKATDMLADVAKDLL